MKAFWIKLAGLAVVCLVLFVYQTQAVSNAKTAALLSELKAKLGGQETAAEPAEDAEEGSEGLYKDGAYEGTGTGYKGEIHVMVTVENGQIDGIEVLDMKDDPAYFNMASELTEDIIAGQTTEGLDTVSGATFSSNGILEAVEDALKEAEN